MSLDYYTFDIKKIIDTLQHYKHFFEHEDLDSRYIREAISNLENFVKYIKHTEQYREERSKHYEGTEEE